MYLYSWYSCELYSNGLIAPESFTQDKTQLRAMINGEDAICGIVIGGSFSNFTTAETQAAYKLLAPVTGPEGVRLTSTEPAGITSKAYITRDAKNVDLCWDILELQYDYTVRMNFRFGPENITRSVDPEVLALYKGNFEVTAGVAPRMAVTDNVWNKATNYLWNAECMPFLATQINIMGEATVLKTEDNKDIPTNEELHYITYSDCQPAEVLGALIYSEDETAALSIIKTPIDNYVKENMTAFATGNRSFDEWDGYVAELQTMGLDKYIEIMQGAYDRANGK